MKKLMASVNNINKKNNPEQSETNEEKPVDSKVVVIKS